MDRINEYRHQIFYQGTCAGTGAGVPLVFKHTQSLSQLMTPAIGVTFLNQILTFVSLCAFSYIHIISFKKE